jgi:RNA polymerase sigma-70 factor (ECF subfamily)
MKATEFYDNLMNLKCVLEHFALRLTMEKADAQDLVQETFLKALLYQERYVKNDNFKAWACTIMRNTYINHYRRRLKVHTYKDHSEEVILINQTQNTYSEDPESTYSVIEMTKCIEQLEDKHRLPLKMYLNGYKYQEIADDLQLSLGTVKSRIFFSRKILQIQLSA